MQHVINKQLECLRVPAARMQPPELRVTCNLLTQICQLQHANVPRYVSQEWMYGDSLLQSMHILRTVQLLPNDIKSLLHNLKDPTRSVQEQYRTSISLGRYADYCSGFVVCLRSAKAFSASGQPDKLACQAAEWELWLSKRTLWTHWNGLPGFAEQEQSPSVCSGCVGSTLRSHTCATIPTHVWCKVWNSFFETM